MNQVKALQTKATKWKQISKDLQTIYDKLASQEESREEWYYKMQIKMLLSKAIKFSNEYAEQTKQLQEK